jgi:hypothetical protein
MRFSRNWPANKLLLRHPGHGIPERLEAIKVVVDQFGWFYCGDIAVFGYSRAHWPSVYLLGQTFRLNSAEPPRGMVIVSHFRRQECGRSRQSGRHGSCNGLLLISKLFPESLESTLADHIVKLFSIRVKFYASLSDLVLFDLDIDCRKIVAEYQHMQEDNLASIEVKINQPHLKRLDEVNRIELGLATHSLYAENTPISSFSSNK